jgi:hypothetical protein
MHAARRLKTPADRESERVSNERGRARGLTIRLQEARREVRP